MDEPLIYFGPGEPITQIGRALERVYWKSFQSSDAQTRSVAYAISSLVLEQSGVDTGFHQALRDPLVDHLTGLYARGAAQVTDHDIDVAIAKCNNSIPTLDRTLEAVDRDGIIRVGTKNFWAEGLARYLGHNPYLANREDDILESLEFLLDRSTHLDEPVHVRTKRITDTIASWSRRRGLRPARELSVPVVTPGSTYFGRADLIVFRKPNPSIVVEIDSQPNERSEPKLQFARRSGALAIWVRWNRGDAEPSRGGVKVLDFCDVPAPVS